MLAGPIVTAKMRGLLGPEFAGRSFGELRGGPVLSTSLDGWTFGLSRSRQCAWSGSPLNSISRFGGSWGFTPKLRHVSARITASRSRICWLRQRLRYFVTNTRWTCSE